MSIRKNIKSLKRNPLGCLLSILISTVITVVSVIVFIGLVLMINTPSIINSRLTEATGFAISADEIYFNPFTGKLHAINLTIENPQLYEENIFLVARSLDATFSLKSLFDRKLVLDSFDIDIKSMECIRVNVKNFNLREFLAGINTIIKFGSELEKFCFKIDSISYDDFLNISPTKWELVGKVDFCEKNISDYKNLLRNINSVFYAKNASFISAGINMAIEDSVK